MTEYGYTLSNTYRWFIDNPDVDLLLDVVKMYDELGSVEMQARTLNLICMLDLSNELKILLNSRVQYDLWRDLLSITDTWTEAWLQAVSENPLRISLCRNQTVRNYCKIVN